MHYLTGLALSDGHHWVVHRKFLTQWLQNAGMGRGSLEEVIKEQAAHLVKSIKEEQLIADMQYAKSHLPVTSYAGLSGQNVDNIPEQSGGGQNEQNGGNLSGQNGWNEGGIYAAGVGKGSIEPHMLVHKALNNVLSHLLLGSYSSEDPEYERIANIITHSVRYGVRIGRMPNIQLLVYAPLFHSLLLTINKDSFYRNHLLLHAEIFCAIGIIEMFLRNCGS